MRIHVKFLLSGTGEELEKWANAEKWVHVGEEVLIGYTSYYKVVRVVHSGQFYVNCYCAEVK